MPSSGRMLSRGLLKRCPWCGNRRLGLSVGRACPDCGLCFDREEGSWLIAITINYGITAAAWVVLFVVWLIVALPDVEVIPLVVASVIQIVLVALVFHPISRTTAAALDLLVHGAHKKMNPELALRFGIRPNFVHGRR